MLHLIGGSGRLGRALARSDELGRVRVLARSTYADWWREGASDAVARHFSANGAPGDTVCVLSGVLDPGRPEAEHERINFALPMQVIEGCRSAGMAVVTFGSVMEGLISRPNPYIAAKARLGRAVAERAAHGDAVLHVRIHTLYGGGEPASFMFLGQMLSALRARRPFAMSSGRQLREYHHVDDDVRAIGVVLGEGLRGTVELNHGEPLSLRDLASGVFAELGCEQLLQLGALPDPPEENLGTVLARPAVLQTLHFRKAVPAIAQEMRALLSSSTTDAADA